MRVGGIDPGKKGFLCVLQDDDDPIFYSLPYDQEGILNISIFEAAILPLDVVFVERPIGVNSDGLMMRHQDFGEMRGIIRKHCEFRWLMPKVWKDALGLTKDKHLSILKAKALYPNADLRRMTPTGQVSQIPDDNRAEALLIAHYGKSVL